MVNPYIIDSQHIRKHKSADPLPPETSQNIPGDDYHDGMSGYDKRTTWSRHACPDVDNRMRLELLRRSPPLQIFLYGCGNNYVGQFVGEPHAETGEEG